MSTYKLWCICFVLHDFSNNNHTVITTNVGLLLGQRLRRCPNNNPTLSQRLMLVVLSLLLAQRLGCYLTGLDNSLPGTGEE